MAFALKDANNVTLIDIATNLPAMYIDYANATNFEFSSDAVYANRKGERAVRWDNAKQGTLTLETELFDYGLLAMALGAEQKEGKENLFTRESAILTAERTITLKNDGVVDLDSISVVKLNEKTHEHVGLPLINMTTVAKKVPAQVTNVLVSVNDKGAKVTFDKADGADAYVIMRGAEVAGTVTTNAFSETGLTPETAYQYKVIATNVYGKAPASAIVKVTTLAEGTTAYGAGVQAQEPELTQAKSNVAEVAEVGASEVTYTVVGNKITLNENAHAGDEYAVYYLEEVEGVRTLTVKSDSFGSTYKIIGDGMIRDEDTQRDEFVQFAYMKAKPQPNFTFTQSATEPASLSITFDLFPDKNKELMTMKTIA